MTPNPIAPLVGIVMGSRSDWETMQHAAQKLEALGVPFEVKVVSAHRTPDVLFSYAEQAGPRGLRAIIAGAAWGRAPAGHDRGQDRRAGAGRAGAVQGPQRHGLAAVDRADAGFYIPVATFAIGNAGASNAALFAAAMLASDQPAIGQALDAFRARQTEDVMAHDDPRQ